MFEANGRFGFYDGLVKLTNLVDLSVNLPYSNVFPFEKASHIFSHLLQLTSLGLLGFLKPETWPLSGVSFLTNLEDLHYPVETIGQENLMVITQNFTKLKNLFLDRNSIERIRELEILTNLKNLVNCDPFSMEYLRLKEDAQTQKPKSQNL